MTCTFFQKSSRIIALRMLSVFGSVKICYGAFCTQFLQTCYYLTNCSMIHALTPRNLRSRLFKHMCDNNKISGVLVYVSYLQRVQKHTRNKQSFWRKYTHQEVEKTENKSAVRYLSIDNAKHFLLSSNVKTFKLDFSFVKRSWKVRSSLSVTDRKVCLQARLECKP